MRGREGRRRVIDVESAGASCDGKRGLAALERVLIEARVAAARGAWLTSALGISVLLKRHLPTRPCRFDPWRLDYE